MRVVAKEKVVTVVFLVLFLLAGHLGIWFVLFPPSPSARLFGFPLHYTIALIVGWPGILLLAMLYSRVANRLDEEMSEDESESAR
ncbi:MAG: hypothetical protein ACE5HT_13745 [Gemmatimonadales bacterium]